MSKAIITIEDETAERGVASTVLHLNLSKGPMDTAKIYGLLILALHDNHALYKASKEIAEKVCEEGPDGMPECDMYDLFNEYASKYEVVRKKDCINGIKEEQHAERTD